MKPIEEFDCSTGFPLEGVTLKEVAKILNGELIGEDRPVKYLALLQEPEDRSADTLTFVTTSSYWNQFCQGKKESVVVPKALIKGLSLPDGKHFIAVDGDAQQAFFEFHEMMCEQQRYPRLKHFIAEGCSIHPRAVLSDGIILYEGVKIDANAVLYPGTVVGKGTWIKSGSVIGGTSLETKTVFGRRKAVTHSGGVYLGRDVEIGSLVSIGKHLFGGFTWVGSQTEIDDFVHIAHAASVGHHCFITAGVDIGGSAKVGNHVRLGPRSCVKNQIEVGDYSYSGIASVIVKNVPPHAFVLGYPAKCLGWMCYCQTKLEPFAEQGTARCEKCGSTFQRSPDGNEVTALTDGR